MERLKMWNKRILAWITALLLLSVSLTLAHAQPPNDQTHERGSSVVYDGVALVRGRQIPNSVQVIGTTEYSISALAKIGKEGSFPLKDANSTYNLVSVNDTYVTFALKKEVRVQAIRAQVQSGPISPTARGDYILVGPFLVRISSSKIEEISVVSERRPAVELIEAKVKGRAIAMIGGKRLVGSWVPSLDGWIFELNWTQQGDLSHVLICRNNTLLSFYGLMRPFTGEVELDSPVSPYTNARISLGDDMVSLLAQGPTLNLSLVHELPIREFLGIYEVAGARFLIKISKEGKSSYGILSPEGCDTCVIDGITYVSDPSFKLDMGLDIPKEGIGGTSIPISVHPGEASNLTLLLPGGISVVMGNEGFDYSLRVRLPLPKTDTVSPIYLTGESEDGIFGIERDIRILKAYDVRLLNETRVFLVGGRGDLHILALNAGPSPLSLLEAELNLTTKGGNVLSLRFPLSIELQSNRSQRILLPLNLPVGDYKGILNVLVRDYSGEIHTISLGVITIVSTGEDPLNVLIAISPDLPGIGDKVRIKVTFTTMVPISKMLVSINSSEELEPISDTSKLLRDIPEGSTKELSFSFRAKKVGPADVQVAIYYSIEGEFEERVYTKEVKIPVGGVSGRAEVSADRTEISVGEAVRFRIRIEDISGNVTVEFPRKMSILEARGIIRGNSVTFNAPGEVEVVGAFSEGGTFVVPTYISVNGSLLVPSNTITIRVKGESSLQSVEMSLRSKLADLNRRFRTLKEASGSLSPETKKRMSEVEAMLKEAGRLINSAEYEKAREVLHRAETEISSLEEYTYSSLDELMNSLIYFLIGAGITSAALLAIRWGRRS